MERKVRKNITKEMANLAISMVQSGRHTINDVANTLEIHRSTVSRILKNFETGIVFEEVAEKRIRTCSQQNSVFSDVDQAIYNIVHINNALTQNEIKEKIEESNISISRSTISRKLKKMNITRKRPTLVPVERNTLEKINLHKLYAAEISRISDLNLVFLDETGFNEHTRRVFGYSSANTKAYINVLGNRNRNRSLICAINKSGIVGYDYVVGSYNSNLFLQFAGRNLEPYFTTHSNSVLIMDNARIHKTEAVLN
uniref:DDE_3 domain-containing protein n=1 Tax=Strongyloides stercoralis TaxID=6248 RepID=A0A0K0E5U7_STRER